MTPPRLPPQGACHPVLGRVPPPPPPSRTNWTRLVPPPVLIGHATPPAAGRVPPRAGAVYLPARLRRGGLLARVPRRARAPVPRARAVSAGACGVRVRAGLHRGGVSGATAQLRPRPAPRWLSHTHTNTNTHSHTHTLTLSLSLPPSLPLSLSLSELCLSPTRALLTATRRAKGLAVGVVRGAASVRAPHARRGRPRRRGPAVVRNSRGAAAARPPPRPPPAMCPAAQRTAAFRLVDPTQPPPPPQAALSAAGAANDMLRGVRALACRFWGAPPPSPARPLGYSLVAGSSAPRVASLLLPRGATSGAIPPHPADLALVLDCHAEGDATLFLEIVFNAPRVEAVRVFLPKRCFAEDVVKSGQKDVAPLGEAAGGGGVGCRGGCGRGACVGGACVCDDGRAGAENSKFWGARCDAACPESRGRACGVTSRSLYSPDAPRHRPPYSPDATETSCPLAPRGRRGAVTAGSGTGCARATRGLTARRARARRGAGAEGTTAPGTGGAGTAGRASARAGGAVRRARTASAGARGTGGASSIKAAGRWSRCVSACAAGRALTARSRWAPARRANARAAAAREVCATRGRGSAAAPRRLRGPIAGPPPPYCCPYPCPYCTLTHSLPGREHRRAPCPTHCSGGAPPAPRRRGAALGGGADGARGRRIPGHGRCDDDGLCSPPPPPSY